VSAAVVTIACAKVGAFTSIVAAHSWGWKAAARAHDTGCPWACKLLDMGDGAPPSPPSARAGVAPLPRTRRRRLTVVILGLGLTLGGGALGVWLAAGSRIVNERLDHRALRSMAGMAARRPRETAPRPLPYTNAAELEVRTRPRDGGLAVDRTPMRRFRMDDGALIQEVLTFPSAIPLDHAQSNTAVVYVYRHGRLGERPVVVWVPGQYVVDRAFVPISWFTREIVLRGADVVLLVPPYHLERTPPGFDSGDAVFATSLADHLDVFAQELSDLRALVAWLRREGAKTVGGFGGSVGAMLLLRMATWETSLDFLTAFIPMLRLADVLDSPEAEPMRRRLQEEGRTVDEMKRLYAALDPSADRPRMTPARISVLYARYDLVAPPAATLAWARTFGVTRVLGYDRGHALALFTRPMYRDYARLLDEDLRALDQR
jgi:dienelactone hydrolase